MAGMRADLYQRMLRELTEQMPARPTISATTRSASPSITSTSRASSSPTTRCCSTSTSRCRPSASASASSASCCRRRNPIRVAEDIAMLDHMTGGRANAGFARGYQRRWVDIMAQQTHGIHGALPTSTTRSTTPTAPAFEENFRIIKKCWTEEMLTYDGQVLEDPGRRDAVDARHHARSGARASRTASSRRSAWCRSRCRSRTRRCSSRSPARRTRSAGAPRRASRRSCRRCMPVYEDKLYERLCRGLGQAARARASACCATSSSPTPTRRRGSCGANFGQFAGRRLVRAVRLPPRHASIPRPARSPTPEEVIAKGYAWSAPSTP